VSSLNQPPASPETSARNWIPQPLILSVRRYFGASHCQVLGCDRRFTVLVAGRRWGKTFLGLFKLLCHAAGARNQVCYFVGPSERQAKEIGWRALKQLVPPVLIRRMRESELEIELVNGSIIKVHGPQSLRGTGLDFVVLDEYAYMPAELWPEVVRPMLADREGRALISSTPCGFNHFYDLYYEAQPRSDCATFQFSTAHGGYVSESELVLLRSTMDPKLYAQEIEASFELQHGRVYHAFARDLNVKDVSLISGPPLLVGMDFNVNPMTAVVAQKIGGQCHVSAEIVLPNSNTFEMMQELLIRYPQQRGVVHPDPSGTARKTSAAVGQTDHAIIRQAGWQVHSLKPYPIVDRINSVNAMFENANRQRRLFIDRSCKTLIRALDGLTYKADSHLPDKSSGLDHAADALGYLIMGVFPMIRDEVSITTVLI
jgi:hypothetical protein